MNLVLGISVALQSRHGKFLDVTNTRVNGC
jgi:hypothetical protein